MIRNPKLIFSQKCNISKSKYVLLISNTAAVDTPVKILVKRIFSYQSNLIQRNIVQRK